MPQPTTAHRYPDAWHAAEDAQERAWMDEFMRGRICLATLEVCPAKQPSPPVVPLATARSH